MGNPFLRTTWFSAGLIGREGPTSQHLLEHSLTAERNVSSTHVHALIRQWVRAKLNVFDVADPGFREFGQVRAVRRPNAASLPACSGIINTAIQTARIERDRIRQAKDCEFFRLRIEYQQRVRSCAGDDNRILSESERIELIHPQEIGILGAARFLPGARELWSG